MSGAGQHQITDRRLSRCPRCKGQGWSFVLRRGNPFAMRIEVLARAMERRECFDCRGTGVTRHVDEQKAVEK
jgi:DnaJ-class molecular chaperone